MRAVVQRVTRGRVTVDGQTVGEITEPGLVVLVGVTHDDGQAQVTKLADKLVNLRMLRTPDGGDDARDEESLLSLGAPALVISQFTLYGSVAKGRRPTWVDAAPGPVAEPLYNQLVDELRRRGIHVETGQFGAMMQVELVNDGPYTLVVEV